MECQGPRRRGLRRVGHLPPRREGRRPRLPLRAARRRAHPPLRAARGRHRHAHLRLGVRLLLDAHRRCCRRRIYARRRFHVIQACNPPDTYFALARLYRPFGVRFVFDHHDLCPELFESRDLDPGRPSKPLMAALRLLERGTYAAADHVITTNESYRDTARVRTGKPLGDFTIVRSSPDPALMKRRGRGARAAPRPRAPRRLPRHHGPPGRRRHGPAGRGRHRPRSRAHRHPLRPARLRRHAWRASRSSPPSSTWTTTSPSPAASAPPTSPATCRPPTSGCAPTRRPPSTTGRP